MMKLLCLNLWGGRQGRILDDFLVLSGQAIFMKKSINIEQNGFVYVYGDERTNISDDFINEPRVLQYADLNIGDKKLLIANAHGKWHPGEKLDTPERLVQSQKILDLLAQFKQPKILCGDFNLMPNTKSIQMFAENLEDLIAKFGIKSTRNKISWTNYGNVQHFADFTFVSKNIKIKSFEVPYMEVSDHLPMVMEFET